MVDADGLQRESTSGSERACAHRHSGVLCGLFFQDAEAAEQQAEWQHPRGAGPSTESDRTGLFQQLAVRSYPCVNHGAEECQVCESQVHESERQWRWRVCAYRLFGLYRWLASHSSLIALPCLAALVAQRAGAVHEPVDGTAARKTRQPHRA